MSILEKNYGITKVLVGLQLQPYQKTFLALLLLSLVFVWVSGIIVTNRQSVGVGIFKPILLYMCRPSHSKHFLLGFFTASHSHRMGEVGRGP